jgi:NAD-dependent SIR2 family protein deacetylase
MENKAVKTIKCQDCGKEFVFTEKDQKFYAEHNFVEPKRCKTCRDLRKNM